jgi:hypothetical protein
MVTALELGFRAGRRSGKSEQNVAGPQVSAIQGAVLGLLGLLLAFSFAAAGTRFFERQDLIVQEANAIGTAYLRADLVGEPYSSELRKALKEYTEHRIAISDNLQSGWSPQAVADIERMHARIWRAASDGVAKHPEFAQVLLSPVNEVIDLHTTRVSASLKRIPWLLMLLLVTCSLLAMADIGYGCGVDGRRRLPLTLPVTRAPRRRVAMDNLRSRSPAPRSPSTQRRPAPAASVRPTVNSSSLVGKAASLRVS